MSPLAEGPVVVLHVLPLAATVVDTSAEGLRSNPSSMPLLQCRPPVMAEQRPNVEGFVAANVRKEGPAASFSQVFRTGGIELATARFRIIQGERTGASEVFLPLIRDDVIRCMGVILAQAGFFGISFPLAVALTLHGFGGCLPAGLEEWDLEDYSRRRGPLTATRSSSAPWWRTYRQGPWTSSLP